MVDRDGGSVSTRLSLNFQETKTQCFHLCVPECLANFDILTLITLPIFRKAEGEKLSFALKEWHTLYYDCMDTNNTAVHSVPTKALLLSS